MSRKKREKQDRTRRASSSHERTYRKLARQLAGLGYLLKGSVQLRWMRCGHSACRCRRGGRYRHGPYYWWTSKVGGKTVTWILSEEEGKLYLDWAENRRRLDAILEKMYLVSAEIARAKTGRPPPSFRRK